MPPLFLFRPEVACRKPRRSMPPTARPAPAWSISAAGTCRSTTAPRSTSTTRCGATRGCSTSRTCGSSTSTAPAAAPRDFLRYALANNVDQLKTPGKALYSCMLADDGGVLDDLIVYFLREDLFRLVVNAATADKDIAWLTALAGALGARAAPRAARATSRSSPCRARRRARKSGTRSPAAKRLAQRSDRSMRQRLPRPAWASCSSRAPATPARTASRSSLPAVHAEALWRALAAAGCGALRPGRARHAAPRGGHEPLRPGHGRERLAAGVGPRLDRRPRERARFRRQGRAARASRPSARARSASSCPKPAACCARTRQCTPMRGEGEITSGTFSPTLAKVDRACPPAARPSRSATPCTSRSATSGSPRAS